MLLSLFAGCTDLIVDEMLGPDGVDADAAAPPAPGLRLPAGQSALYFYRIGEFIGAGDDFTIYARDEPVANMSWKTVHVEPVAPGPTRIWSEDTPELANMGLLLAVQKKPAITVTARSGQVTYIRVGIDPITGGPTLREVDLATATSEVGAFRTAKPL
jgi:hypothetical protein